MQIYEDDIIINTYITKSEVPGCEADDFTGCKVTKELGNGLSSFMKFIFSSSHFWYTGSLQNATLVLVKRWVIEIM